MIVCFITCVTKTIDSLFNKKIENMMRTNFFIRYKPFGCNCGVGDYLPNFDRVA